MTVAGLTIQKVPTVDLCVAVSEAAHEMRKCRANALVVVDRTLPIGVVTDGDLATAFSSAECTEATVADVIDRHAFVLRPDEDAGEAIRRMRTLGIQRAPVVSRRGKLRGLFTLDPQPQAVPEHDPLGEL
jgi:CBS domain-containing protein